MMWVVQRKTGVSEALAPVGVSQEVFLEAVVSGLGMATNIDSETDPSILRGIFIWGKIFGALCRSLRLQGWKRVEMRNWPRMVNAEKTVAIAVMTGDINTAHGRAARPRSRRGPMALAAVVANQMVLALTGMQERFATSKSMLKTYFLLYRRDGDTVHVVLGLPSAMKDGAVQDWDACIDVGTLKFTAVDSGVDGPGRSFEVDVTEKNKEEE